MTHANGHFAIGKTHSVCQDYVRTGQTPDGRAYAIVADGCSGSPDTDIGVRLLVLAAEQHLCKPVAAWTVEDYRPELVNFEQIAEAAEQAARVLGLATTCLDATLLVAIEEFPPEGYTSQDIAVYQMGDGVVAVRHRDGTYSYTSTEFESGAPYYPNYLTEANSNRRRALYRQPDNVVKIKSYHEKSLESGVEQDMHDYHKFWSAWATYYSKRDVDLVVLLTDGAHSFRKGREFEPVPLAEVVDQVLAVKATAGEFMLRRMTKFLGVHCVKQGWSHLDDFGVGAIFVDAPVQEVK